MIQYYDWAKGMLDQEREPSIYDWSDMQLSEMADRALAICKVAQNETSWKPVSAFFCLEKMAQALKEKYQRDW